MTARSEVIKTLRRRGVVWKNNNFWFGNRKLSADEAYGVYSLGEILNTKFGSLENLLQKQQEQPQRSRVSRNPHDYIANPYVDCVDCVSYGCPRRLRTSLQLRLQVMLDKTKFLTADSKQLLTRAMGKINTIGFEEMADLLDSVLIQLDRSRSATMVALTRGKPFSDILNTYKDDKLYRETKTKKVATRGEHDKNYEAFRTHIDPIMETLKNLRACR